MPDLAPWELLADFSPPRVAVPLIHRRRLLWPTNPPDSPALTLIVGPPGYGKTSLASQHYHLARDERLRTVWLTLDASLAEPSAFARSLARCFSGPHPADNIASLRATNDRAVLARALDLLIAQAKGCWIYLDDFHLTATRDNCALLEWMISKLPENVRLVVTTRSRPKISLGRLLSTGSALLIEGEKLRFTVSEGKTFLGNSVPPAKAETMIERTEGWPGGLQLCKLMQKFGEAGSDDADSIPIGEHSDEEGIATRFIWDYLADQVFHKLSEEDQKFLIATSILDRFDVKLAEDVSGDPLAASRIADLYAANFFLFAINDSQYRYHNLFAAFLQRQLELSREFDPATLHKRAAAELLQRGDLKAAIRHALNSEDIAFLDGFAATCGGWRLAFAIGTAVWAGLANLPAESIRERPGLLLCKAYYLAHQGRLAQARGIYLHLLKLDDPQLNAELLAFDVLMALYEDRLLTASQWEALKRRPDAIEDEPDVRVSALIAEMLAWEAICMGDFEEAIESGWKSVRLCEQAEASMIRAYALMAIGSGHMMAGQMNRAELHFTSARAHVIETLGRENDQHLAAQSYLAEILLERGDFQGARQLAFPAWEGMDDLDLWVDLGIAIISVVSWSEYWRAGLNAALRICNLGLSRLGRRGLSRLEQVVTALAMRICLADGNTDRATQIARKAKLPEKFDQGHAEMLWRPCVHLGIALADWHLAMGRLEEAETALAVADDRIEATGARRYTAELCLIRAHISLATGDRPSALKHFGHALEAAEYADQILPFTTLGAWADPILASIETERSTTLRRDWMAKIHEIRGTRQPASQPEAPPEQFAIPQGLSPREGEVFRQLCLGLTSKEIAHKLDLSVNTILSYRRSLYHKTGTSTRSRLIAIARRTPQ